MSEPIQTLPLWIELAAMMTTAVYGGAEVRSRNVPIYGTLLSGLLMGVGGGMTRDILLGLEPAAMTDWFYIPAVLAAAVLGATVLYKILSRQLPNLVIDGIAFGLLITVGAKKAMDHGAPFSSIILCGILTASAGGMIVDMLTRHRAAVVSQAHWFASALLVGTLSFWVIDTYVGFYYGVIASVIIVTTLRVFSVTRNWPSPKWPGESEDMNA